MSSRVAGKPGRLRDPPASPLEGVASERKTFSHCVRTLRPQAYEVDGLGNGRASISSSRKPNPYNYTYQRYMGLHELACCWQAGPTQAPVVRHHAERKVDNLRREWLRYRQQSDALRVDGGEIEVIPASVNITRAEKTFNTSKNCLQVKKLQKIEAVQKIRIFCSKRVIHKILFSDLPSLL